MKEHVDNLGLIILSTRLLCCLYRKVRRYIQGDICPVKWCVGHSVFNSNVTTCLHALQETTKNLTWTDQGTKSQNMWFLSVCAEKYRITESANLRKNIWDHPVQPMTKYFLVNQTMSLSATFLSLPIPRDSETSMCLGSPFQCLSPFVWRNASQCPT